MVFHVGKYTNPMDGMGYIYIYIMDLSYLQKSTLKMFLVDQAAHVSHRLGGLPLIHGESQGPNFSHSSLRVFFVFSDSLLT